MVYVAIQSVSCYIYVTYNNKHSLLKVMCFIPYKVYVWSRSQINPSIGTEPRGMEPTWPGIPRTAALSRLAALKGSNSFRLKFKIIILSVNYNSVRKSQKENPNE